MDNLSGSINWNLSDTAKPKTKKAASNEEATVKSVQRPNSSIMVNYIKDLTEYYASNPNKRVYDEIVLLELAYKSTL